jgi:hypothetical protein
VLNVGEFDGGALDVAVTVLDVGISERVGGQDT